MHDDFPNDEFDTSNDTFTRAGVHRNKKSAWSKVWPFLLVAVLCGALGVGSVYLLTRNPDSKVAEYLGEVVDSSSTAPEQEPTDPDSDAAGTEVPDEPEEEPTAGPDDQTEPEPTDEATDEATDEPTDEPTPEVVLNRSASVRVLNAGAPAGAAAELATKLTNDAWTSVEATNFEGTRPTASVIYYRGEQNRANAEHIGELAGISNVLDVDSLRADVSVVLMR